MSVHTLHNADTAIRYSCHPLSQRNPRLEMGEGGNVQGGRVNVNWNQKAL